MIYLIQAINRKMPDALSEHLYIHVKGRADGLQVLIIANESNILDIEGTILLSKEEAQALLDQWIDDENVNPEVGLKGEFVVQSKIDLGKYL